jgi:hypothetical protein
MAKKTAKKKAAPAKKAAPTKGSKKKSAPRHADEPIELKLDEVEQKAVDLVATSDALCNDLEVAVTAAVAKTVGAVYKKHKIKLDPAQAETVALVLFGN